MSTALFQQIEKVVPNLDGWCEVQKAQALAAIILGLRPNVTVEIGIFGGRSFLPMAMAHKEIGRGMAIGIDAWDNQAASEGYETDDEKFWSNVNFNDVFQKFSRMVIELGVQNCVKVFKRRSDDVEPPAVIDLFHCDGQHTDQAVKDCQRFGTKIRIGGIAVLDDLNWRNGGVLRAKAFIQSIGFKELYPLGTGAVFQKVA
jgi:methyltransferase family protein